MLGLELKKMIKSRILFVLCVSLLILFAGRVLILYKGIPDSSAAKSMKNFKKADRLNNTVLNDEINLIAEKAFSSDDSNGSYYRTKYLAYSEVIKSRSYVSTYQDDMKKYIKSLVVQRAENKKEGKETSQLDKMIDYYNVKRNVETVNDNDFYNYLKLYTMYDYNIYFSVVMMISGAVLFAFVFHEEDIRGMREISLSSCKGRQTSFCVKFSAVFIVMFMLNAGVVMIEFAGGVYRGIYKWSAPIQSISYFKYCPFSVNIWQYLIITGLLRFFVIITFIGLLLIVDKGSRGIIRCLSAGFLISAFCFVLSSPYLNHDNKGYEMVKQIDRLRSICPFCLFMPEYYFEGFDSVVVLGIPVFRFTTAIISGLIIIIMGFIIGLNDKKYLE